MVLQDSHLSTICRSFCIFEEGWLFGLALKIRYSQPKVPAVEWSELSFTNYGCITKNGEEARRIWFFVITFALISRDSIIGTQK